MSVTLNPDSCPCTSGIKYNSCCGLKNISPPSQQDYDSVDRLYAECREAFDYEEYKIAVEHCVNILNRIPNHDGVLNTLQKIRKIEKNYGAALKLGERIVKIHSRNISAHMELADTAIKMGKHSKARHHQRQALRVNPTSAQLHQQQAEYFEKVNERNAALQHLKQAHNLQPENTELTIKLARSLYTNDQVEKSNQMLEDILDQHSHTGAIRLLFKQYESQGKTDECLELMSQYSQQIPERERHYTQAKLHIRSEQYDDALSAVNEAIESTSQPSADYFRTKGKILEKVGLYAEAFTCFRTAAENQKQHTDNRYNAQEFENRTQKIQEFFTQKRASILPRAETKDGSAQPLFITGFTRSGTTLTEQILSSHSDVIAGDELPFLAMASHEASHLLRSELPYPVCLADLWYGENWNGITHIRNHYMGNAESRQLTHPKNKFFTDKMPMNELHLGLINMLFPESPVIHLIRHPLDVVISNYCNSLSHGNHQSLDLKDSAAHYLNIFLTVEHYLDVMPNPNYKRVIYEDLVADKNKTINELLTHCGLSDEESCYDFYKSQRVPRTPSYIQVTKDINDSAMFRYKNYIDELGPAIEILEPLIDALGYQI